MVEEATPITVYGHPRSGNVYKPLLMLALTGTAYEFRTVDLPNGAQREAEFLAINPFGKVPVLRHGEHTICQSNSMLLYLSALTGKFGASNQAHRLRISEWLFWEQDVIFQGVGRLRFVTNVLHGDPAVIAFLKASGAAGLDRLEDQLGQTAFLAGDDPTIADIAVFAYTRLAEDAGHDMDNRPRVVAWRHAIEALPGFDTPENLCI